MVLGLEVVLKVVVRTAVLRWLTTLPSISSRICSRMLSMGPGVRSVVVAGTGGIVLAIPISRWGSAVVIKFWIASLYQFSIRLHLMKDESVTSIPGWATDCQQEMGGE